MKTLTPGRITAAYAIAIAADALQIGLFPLFAEGILSPFDLILDVAVCVLLTRLIGWHYALLPGFIVELVPVADLVPTWTLAVYLASRRRATAESAGHAQQGQGHGQSADYGGAGPAIDVEASFPDRGEPYSTRR
jgi:hypothetical protein